MVVHEAHQRAGNEPSSLNPGQEKSIRLHELTFGREFLDEGRDGWPEHPEAGGDQGIHQIELPDLDAMPKREDGHRDDDRGAHSVEPHDQAAAIFAVNNHAGEGKHQHGRNGLQNGEGAERHLRVRGFEDVPGDGGRVHPAAQHGDHVGGKDEVQRTSTEDVAHQFTLAELARKFHHGDKPVTQKPGAELYWLVCNF